MVARSGLPVTRRADLRVPWSPQPGWPRSALARVARPVRAVMRWISQPAGLLEEVRRTLRTACAADLVGDEITDSSLVFIDEYAGVPAPRCSSPASCNPWGPERGHGQN